MFKLFIYLVFAISCISQEKSAILKNGEKPILRYNAEFVESPIPEKAFYGRSGFIHPVFSPSGKVLTEAFPKSHPHQHAVMFAWTSGLVQGRKVDFWNSQKEEGRVEHVETVLVSDNKIITKLSYIDLTSKTPNVVLNEKWEVTAIASDKYNIFDLKSTQTCPSEEPFKIGKYHYGGLCLRTRDLWTKNNVKIITSEGKDRISGNHSRPKWVKITGEIAGEKCGIVVIQHKTNFRFPQPVRIHPKHAYLSFSPMVLGEFQIEPEKAYTSKFRFVVFDGELNAADIQELSDSFKN